MTFLNGVDVQAGAAFDALESVVVDLGDGGGNVASPFLVVAADPDFFECISDLLFDVVQPRDAVDAQQFGDQREVVRSAPLR